MFVDESTDRGQVGIGTLIVFIAMVLVAAIAAGVLINTAGMLQSQAEATGEESTDLVSERIDVDSAVGQVDSDGGDEFTDIRLSTSPAAGADDIDLTETIVQAVGPTGQSNLVYGDGFQTEDGETVLGDENGNIVLEFDPGQEPFGEPEDEDDVIDVSGTIEDTDGTLDHETVYVGFAGQTVETTNGEFTFTNVPEDEDIVLVAFAEGYEPIEVTIDTEEDGPDLDGDGNIVSPDLELDDGEAVDEEGVTVVVDVDEGDEDIYDLDANYGGVIGEYDADSEEITFDGVEEEATDHDIGAITTGQQPYHADGEDVINTDQWDGSDVDLSENFEGPDMDAFGEGEEATLDIVSPSGATTTVELRAPDLLNEGEAVRL